MSAESVATSAGPSDHGSKNTSRDAGFRAIARATSRAMTFPDPSQMAFRGDSRKSRGMIDSSTYPFPPRHAIASRTTSVHRLVTQYLATGVAMRRRLLRRHRFRPGRMHPRAASSMIPEFDFEPNEPDGVLGSVREKPGEQETAEALRRLGQHEEGVAHGCRCEPLVTGQPVFVGPGRQCGGVLARTSEPPCF